MSHISALIDAGILKRLSKAEDLQGEMAKISEELEEGFIRHMAGVAIPLTYKDIMEGKFIGNIKPPKYNWVTRFRTILRLG